MLKLFNEEISNDYFGLLIEIIDDNVKSTIKSDYE